MPNIKSAKKRVRVIQSKTAVNRTLKSSLKTSVKKAKIAIADGDPAYARDVFRSVQSDIDRAAARGVLHKNTAARRKSRLAAKVNAVAGS